MIRESVRHYIPASDDEIKAMLSLIGSENLDDLFNHIPESVRMTDLSAIPAEQNYDAIRESLESLAGSNNNRISFLGDGLPHFKVHEIVPFVSAIRNLTTAYTPYQPERSQGTLLTHWIYQCLMSQLTGFEAINASLYDRSTAIFEAACVSLRLIRKADTVLVSELIYPGDIEVLKTLTANTGIHLEFVPADPDTGRISISALSESITRLQGQLGGLVFPQVNSLGILEDVDQLTRLCRKNKIKSIAIVDPVLLATGGLKSPDSFGDEGADMIVGEAQHLAIGANFGGPGLGLFGIRYNKKVRNDIRSTPGRYAGKATDLNGRECRVMVLSTREQHIRKEKATSNICSNQAFLATLAGASLLAKGESGTQTAISTARKNALSALRDLVQINDLTLAWPDAPFFNEFVIRVPEPVKQLQQDACQTNLHIGVDVSDRIAGVRDNLLKISFDDRQDETSLKTLTDFMAARYGRNDTDREVKIPIPPGSLLRTAKVGLPEIPLSEIKAYYQKLGDLNVSPDNACYPLGSCTMKYNPHINDWAAGLAGFTDTHPQAPIEDVQGCLRILYETQEWFKSITGLPGVTTQPVAGAQGELTGIKLFQAYHADRDDLERDIILIPKSAHGTNFATATMAGFENKVKDGRNTGIVYLEADGRGQIDMRDLKEKIARYGPHISGIMITNPNTSGVFESDFKTIADWVHEVGGLVYMDGANMNAIAGWVDLNALGVDAVHNNLHKTWSIPHGGGGPGDAIVAVSQRLVDFLPGYIIRKTPSGYRPTKARKSIGSFHRHWGNFAHKIRCYCYLLRLGSEGIRRMSATAVLASRYLFGRLNRDYATLPQGAAETPRMHEFILTLDETDFHRLEKAGIPRPTIIPRIGKLFLDFGFHAPTVAWPETFGLMIEPTESYTKAELDRFAEAVRAILKLVRDKPEVLNHTPFFTPVDRVDEVTANRNLCLQEKLTHLPEINANRIDPEKIASMSIDDIYREILARID